MFWRAFAIAVVAGIVLAALAPLFAVVGQWFMGAEPRVIEAMDTYIRIRLLGAPFSLINYAILGYVLGRGEGALALLLQLVLNGINIVLSILLGLHLGWGVAGVAWGTVGGELAAMLLGLAIVWRGASPRHRACRASSSSTGKAFGRDDLAQPRHHDPLLRAACRLRAVHPAGRAVRHADARRQRRADEFLPRRGFFLDGFATAAEQLAGRAVGARYEPAFRRAVWLSSLWGFALAGARHAVFARLRRGTDRASSRPRRMCGQLPATYLPWAAFTALSGVLAFQMDGVFIGATWSRDMRNMMLLSFLVFVAALSALDAGLRQSRPVGGAARLPDRARPQPARDRCG